MSWINEQAQKRTWLESLCIKILKTGPIPKHVAFIMDGNRRYAKNNKIKTIDGHSRGFEKLTEVLQWCNDFGIEQVTVYAFSIENFKRPEEEVNGLMLLAKEKFKRLLEEKEKLFQYGVCIRVLGNMSLLDEELQELIHKSIECTKNNNKCFLNVAFSYTSREEIVEAVKLLAEGISCDELDCDDISDDILERCLYTHDCPIPDLLLRTSEVRFSDFLLWQSAYSFVYFTQVLWPDFSIWNLMAGIFNYQRYYNNIITAREYAKEEFRDNKMLSSKCSNMDDINEIHSERLSCFLKRLEVIKLNS